MNEYQEYVAKTLKSRSNSKYQLALKTINRNQRSLANVPTRPMRSIESELQHVKFNIPQSEFFTTKTANTTSNIEKAKK